MIDASSRRIFETDNDQLWDARTGRRVTLADVRGVPAGENFRVVSRADGTDQTVGVLLRLLAPALGRANGIGDLFALNVFAGEDELRRMQTLGELAAALAADSVSARNHEEGAEPEDGRHRRRAKKTRHLMEHLGPFYIR